jgi:hypothetical protein
MTLPKVLWIVLAVLAVVLLVGAVAMLYSPLEVGDGFG